MKIITIDKNDIDRTKTTSINHASGQSVPLPSAIYHLKSQVNRAVVLGNGAKSKVKILFQTKEGLRLVHTTVWAATEDYLILKGGRSIPMDAVLDIVE